MPGDGTHDLLMEKLVGLLIDDLAASEDFDEPMLAALRDIAEAGELASVNAIKRAIHTRRAD